MATETGTVSSPAPAPAAPAAAAAPSAPATTPSAAPTTPAAAPAAPAILATIPKGSPRQTLAAVRAQVTPPAGAAPSTETAIAAAAPTAAEVGGRNDTAPPTTTETAAKPPALEGAADETEDALKPVGTLSERVTRALAGVADPEARRELTRAIQRNETYSELCSIKDLRKRIELAPTLAIHEQQAHASTRAFQIQDALYSGTPEGVDFFFNALAQEAPQAVEAIVERVADGLEQFPRTYKRIARGALRYAVEVLRGEAATGKGLDEETRAVDLDIAGTILEKRFGLAGSSAAAAPKEPPIPPQVAQELDQLRADAARREQNEAGQFLAAASKAYLDKITGEVDADISAANADGWLTEQGVAKVKSEILARIRTAISRNDPLSRAVRALVNGPRTAETQKQITTLIYDNARGVKNVVANEVLLEHRNAFHASQSERTDRQTRAESRKDLGAAGASNVSVPMPAVKFDRRNPKGVIQQVREYVTGR